MHRGRKTRLAAAVAVAALSWAGAAAAQDDATEVEAIIVTAQRVAEDIQDVPASVTAISGEKLDVIKSAGGDIRMLSARVPSLTMESSFGRTFPRPYIRGLGNTDFDLNASQPVSFVYDDVVLETPVLKGLPIFDIAQVEVLRGPQGTLFGRNTPAGVLKFDSVRPGQTLNGYGQISYGRFNAVNAEAAVGGPMIEGKLAFRVSTMLQRRDDWVDNVFTGKDNVSEGYEQYAVRGQLLWTPTEAVELLGNLHYMHLNGTPRVFRANIIQKGTNDFVAGFKRDEIAQDAQSRAFQKVTIKGGNVRMNIDFGAVELDSITAYEQVKTISRADIDGGFGAVFAPPFGPGFIPFPSETADGMPDHHQFSQEVRLSSQEGPFRWQVGAFYFDEGVTIESFDYATLAGGALDGYAIQHQDTTAWALFGTASYDVTEQLTLTGGLRYSDDEKKFDAKRFLSPFGAPPTPVLRANPKSDDISWNLSATYEASDDVNLYARVAKGYRAPSIQGRVLFGDSLSIAGTETLISYEAGVKAYLMDRRVRANASVFYYRVDDLQVTAVGGGLNFNRLLNAEHATGKGFEVDFEAKITPDFLVTAGLSLNDTEFDDPTLATAPCGGGCTVLDPPGALAGTVNIDGNSLPNAPKWIANVTARYAWPMANGEVYLYTDWAYRSKINFLLYKSAEFSDDKLLEGGLRLGYQDMGGWEVAVFGRNITNDKSLEGGIDFDNLTGFVNEPRIWGVEVKAKF